MSTVDIHHSVHGINDSVEHFNENENQTRTSFNSPNPSASVLNINNKHNGPVPPTPFVAGFWDKEIAFRRNLYFKVVGSGAVFVILVIFGVLSIFWGSLFRVNTYIHKLEGWVVDFDGGPIGQTVIQAFQNNTGLPEQMTWTVVDASQFPNGLADIEEAIVQEKTWVAVTINQGASTNLSAAVASADSSYNGTTAVTSYAAEARNENGYSMFLFPIMSVPLGDAVKAYALQHAQQLAANTSVDFQTLLSQAPNVITQPIYYTIANIRPFDAPVAEAVDFVGLIYLLILSFIVCMMNFQARVVVSGLNRHLTLRSLIMLRCIVPIILYFFVSCFFSLLSVAFQAPFSRVFGGWGFVIYWMMNWMGMCAMGLTLESVITILTPGFTPLFLVLWIISNVSVASVPIEVLPGIFKYGYASPFYNVSRTVRTVLFNTRNQIGLNFGVQIAWIAISLIVMPILTAIMRKKEEREWARQQATAETINKEKEKVV